MYDRESDTVRKIPVAPIAATVALGAILTFAPSAYAAGSDSDDVPGKSADKVAHVDKAEDAGDSGSSGKDDAVETVSDSGEKPVEAASTGGDAVGDSSDDGGSDDGGTRMSLAEVSDGEPSGGQDGDGSQDSIAVQDTGDDNAGDGLSPENIVLQDDGGGDAGEPEPAVEGGDLETGGEDAGDGEPGVTLGVGGGTLSDEEVEEEGKKVLKENPPKDKDAAKDNLEKARGERDEAEEEAGKAQQGYDKAAARYNGELAREKELEDAAKKAEEEADAAYGKVSDDIDTHIAEGDAFFSGDRDSRKPFFDEVTGKQQMEDIYSSNSLVDESEKLYQDARKQSEDSARKGKALSDELDDMRDDMDDNPIEQLVGNLSGAAADAWQTLLDAVDDYRYTNIASSWNYAARYIDSELFNRFLALKDRYLQHSVVVEALDHHFNGGGVDALRDAINALLGSRESDSELMADSREAKKQVEAEDKQLASLRSGVDRALQAYIDAGGPQADLVRERVAYYMSYRDKFDELGGINFDELVATLVLHDLEDWSEPDGEGELAYHPGMLTNIKRVANAEEYYSDRMARDMMDEQDLTYTGWQYIDRANLSSMLKQRLQDAVDDSVAAAQSEGGGDGVRLQSVLDVTLEDLGIDADLPDNHLAELQEIYEKSAVATDAAAGNDGAWEEFLDLLRAGKTLDDALVKLGKAEDKVAIAKWVWENYPDAVKEKEKKGTALADTGSADDGKTSPKLGETSYAGIAWNTGVISLIVAVAGYVFAVRRRRVEEEQ